MPLNINNVHYDNLYPAKIPESAQNGFNLMTGCAFVAIMKQISDLSLRSCDLFKKLSLEIKDISKQTESLENKKQFLQQKIKQTSKFTKKEKTGKKLSEYILKNKVTNPFENTPKSLKNALNLCEKPVSFYSADSPTKISHKKSIIRNIQNTEEIQYILRTFDDEFKEGNVNIEPPLRLHPIPSLLSINSYNYPVNMADKTLTERPFGHNPNFQAKKCVFSTKDESSSPNLFFSEYKNCPQISQRMGTSFDPKNIVVQVKKDSEDKNSANEPKNGSQIPEIFNSVLKQVKTDPSVKSSDLSFKESQSRLNIFSNEPKKCPRVPERSESSSETNYGLKQGQEVVKELNVCPKKISFDGLMAELNTKMSNNKSEQVKTSDNGRQSTINPQKPTEKSPKRPQLCKEADKVVRDQQPSVNLLMDSIRKGKQLNSVGDKKCSTGGNAPHKMISALTNALDKRRHCMNNSSNDSDDVWSD